ncbi:IclR family transcriptional regulator [Chelativorans sp. YIM 93263]|uniref:IclR family transcriptional regulator n=1 Tax=Chelativorans sp. YIM 93263 TaxID=2906648 RepID=UPI0023796E43|nr:IclR family transcriptional regulator [Chelativorans sp. YIM 93263]
MRSILEAEHSTRTVSDADADAPLFVQALARGMQVLSAFHTARKPLTLSEIASACGMSKSAVQRVIHTLRELGYVERATDDRGYVPGIRILDHTLDYQRLNPLIAHASPVLLELRRNVRERVDLSLRDDLRVVYASRLQSKRETFFATLVGHSVPIFCTSGGWAMMAHMSDEEVDDILARSDRRPFTAKTITEPRAIRSQIRQARQAGYALALEQVLPGEVAIGVAIRDGNGVPQAAIHVVGSLGEWEPDAFGNRFAPLAVEAAQAISRY